MDPVTGAVAGGVLSGGLGLIGSLISNQSSAAQAEKQMDFQKEMSNTAHQREVDDLKAAGLNPILSALGSGASTPGGAQGTVNDLGSHVEKGFNTGLAIRTAQSTLDNTDADTGNKRAEKANINQDTQNKISQNGLINAQAIATAKQIDELNMRNQILKETLPSQIKKLKLKEIILN